MAKEPDDPRRARLKAALRENLKRRKEQVRARVGRPPTERDGVSEERDDG